ncbi:MAG: GNAT family N-acetyltransferase [Bauldia sp.]
MPEEHPAIEIRPVGPQAWPDFEALFEAPGGPKYCWCMAWRKTREETRELWAIAAAEKAAGRPSPGRAARKAAMKGRITGGVPVGLLAYDGDEPVAWCSVAPRPTFRGLGGPTDHVDAPNKVWSIACFYVKRRRRGEGIAGELVEAACDYAAKSGAKVIEAYPVQPGSPSYRFMGFVPMFEAHGFAAVATAGNRRTVMRKEVGE